MTSFNKLINNAQDNNMGEPQIQRGAYNQTPKREDRQQAPGFDPNAFMQMLAMMQQGTPQIIEAARKPVGQISQSSQNRPRYDIMNDPNYKPGVNPQYGRVGKDKLVQSGAAQPMQQGPVQQQPNMGQGFQGMLPGGIPWSADQPARTLSAAPQPAPQSFPGGINPLTGMKPNTLPGDPGYMAQGQRQGMSQPQGMPAQQPQQQQRDPAMQNLVDLSMLIRGYKQDNPQLQNPIGAFGVDPVTDAGDQSFSPGSAPNWRPGQQVGQPQQASNQGWPQGTSQAAIDVFTGQGPKELNKAEGFNQPIKSNAPWQDVVGNNPIKSYGPPSGWEPQQVDTGLAWEALRPSFEPQGPRASDWSQFRPVGDMMKAFLPLLTVGDELARPGPNVDFSPKVGGNFIPQYKKIKKAQYDTSASQIIKK
jgi:hypothetical protein